MKYLDLAIANETIKTTDIKGKDYAEVNQRIKAFRMVYPTGFIKTNLIGNKDGICVFEAKVGYYNNAIYENKQFMEEVVLATGTAYEKEDSSFINKTSYIENCETSAVGRALGMCGFGIDVSVASAEEVQNAIQNQEPTKKEANNYVIDFGKHKGKKLTEVPKEYIEWMLGNTKNERLIKLIELATGITIPDEEEQKHRLEMISIILGKCDELQIDPEEITKKFKVESLGDLTMEQMNKCYMALKKKEVENE